MDKKYIFLFIIFLIISISKCEEEELESEEEFEEDIYDNSADVAAFQESLKDYLIKNDLYESDRLIEREEMKKIFLEIILDQDPEGTPDYLKGVIEYLTNHFMKVYYKKKKNEIRGKDIYDLIDILAISRKFQQLTGNPDYDDFEEEDLTGDEMGEPNSDI